ncbi:hypothetical protein ACQ0MK_00110 [Thalassospira lucentensis]|uniref:hypothetical protein n=1 Tax=Thalassospira lucentensis TaxID=168935 RepID=UPI003D2EC31C
MYNLIITGDAPRASLNGFELIDSTRFGEYTADSFFNHRNEKLTEEILKRAVEFPAILATEEIDGEAYLAQLREARILPGRIVFDLNWRTPISYGLIRTHQKKLGIADFEFSRNHWAVKDIELNSIDDFRLALAAGSLGPAYSPAKNKKSVQVVSICHLALTACRERYALMAYQTPNEQDKLEAHQIETQCLDSLIYSLESFLALDHISDDELAEHGHKFAEQILSCLSALSKTKNGERIASTAIGTILLGISTAFSDHISTDLSTPLLFASTFGPQVLSSIKK